ncbi:hypothetical protein FRB95_003889 [Tulasnella sp. JGI-2019a]|nr:hypothetical protein FRB93_001268 [Tulasnella sp. JGI-2019a]KAG9030494.1 hypothetical protein FRB95_003889 [Tulasnella sp. JGI-2019a]
MVARATILSICLYISLYGAAPPSNSRNDNQHHLEPVTAMGASIGNYAAHEKYYHHHHHVGHVHPKRDGIMGVPHFGKHKHHVHGHKHEHHKHDIQHQNEEH